MQMKVNKALKTSLCILQFNKYRGMWDTTACFMNCIADVLYAIRQHDVKCLKTVTVIHLSYQQESCKWCPRCCLNLEKWFPDIFPIKCEVNKLPQTSSISPCVTLHVGRWWKNKKIRACYWKKKERSPSLQSLACPWSWGGMGKAERTDHRTYASQNCILRQSQVFCKSV